jgi:hypothetical protein
MLFLVFGSSCSGKSAALAELRGRLLGVAVHDFDEIGVPPEPDIAWRHRSNELWIRRALEYQADGIDLLLAGQTPVGELLEAPSAPLLGGVAACLLDCDDETRLARLRARPASMWSGAPERWPDLLSWAAWMRKHAADPQLRVRVIDTSQVSLRDVADELAAWIEEERALVQIRPSSA